MHTYLYENFIVWSKTKSCQTSPFPFQSTAIWHTLPHLIQVFNQNLLRFIELTLNGTMINCSIHRSRWGNFICVKFQLFSYPLIYTCVLGAQKNPLIETVLLSTHNIGFGCEIKKIIVQYALLSGGLSISADFSATKFCQSVKPFNPLHKVGQKFIQSRWASLLNLKENWRALPFFF